MKISNDERIKYNKLRTEHPKLISTTTELYKQGFSVQNIPEYIDYNILTKDEIKNIVFFVCQFVER